MWICLNQNALPTPRFKMQRVAMSNPVKGADFDTNALVAGEDGRKPPILTIL